MRVSYFAVSLPDFLIFDDDLNKRNQAHCYYLIGLANLGLGNMDAAAQAFVNAPECNPLSSYDGKSINSAKKR